MSRDKSGVNEKISKRFKIHVDQGTRQEELIAHAVALVIKTGRNPNLPMIPDVDNTHYRHHCHECNTTFWGISGLYFCPSCQARNDEEEEANRELMVAERELRLIKTQEQLVKVKEQIAKKRSGLGFT